MKTKQFFFFCIAFLSLCKLHAQNSTVLQTSTARGINSVVIGVDAGAGLPTVAVNPNTGPLNNSYLGWMSGNAATGSYNTFLGAETGMITSSHYNVFLGDKAGKNNTGMANVFVGVEAGQHNIGKENIFIGRLSGLNNVEGANNTYLGTGSGYTNNGNNNTYIGNQAGGQSNIYRITQNSGNVFIGNAAGYNYDSSNRLIIHNVESNNPLIDGSFGVPNDGSISRKLRFNVNANVDSRVEIAATSNRSGLKFENLKSTTTVLAPSSGKVLTVDDEGNVVLTTDSNDGTGTNVAWNLTGNAGTTPGTNFIGTTDDKNFIFKRFNVLAGGVSATNISLGVNSLNPSVAGTNNVAVGTNALSVNTSGLSNVAMGGNSLVKNTSGRFNTAIGVGTLALNQSGLHNVALGYQAGAGSKNNANTFLGCQSGYDNSNGIANVFLGFNSGFRELGSNKLYIQNSKSDAPLIYGDFASKNLIFNVDSVATSRVTVRAFTTTDGTSGLRFSNLKSNFSPSESGSKFLTVDGNGDVVLKNVAVVPVTDNSLYANDGIINDSTALGGLRTVDMNNTNIFFKSRNNDSNGRIYIGVTPVFPTDTGNYKLYVENGILTEKVKIALRNESEWKDSVFASDYSLMPLNEVESFVKENKHLPGIESAEELVKSGLDLGDMQAKQMGKIEELTLYVIEQNKILEKQNKEIEELKAQMNMLLSKNK